MGIKFPKDVLKHIKAVKNKRARFVLEKIVEKGSVTTEEIKRAGYDHPPRAARDVRELGFMLKTIKTKSTTGRSIAAYTLDLEAAYQLGKTGRKAMPKKQRDDILIKARSKCQICGGDHNLQVDHRIPYEVAGESQAHEVEPYQILDGSCNRKKSWDCEHCKNWLELKDVTICGSCYWANIEHYTHVAMRNERRADLVWIADEVNQFESIQKQAGLAGKTVGDQIKTILLQSQKNQRN